MFYLNEIRLFGRSVADAEFKNVGKDSTLATFRLVSNRRVKKRDGTYTDKSTYVDCEVWGQRAEYARDKIKRGTPVLIGGQLETDEWEKDGQKRSKLKIYCNSVQVEYKKADGDGQAATGGTPQQAQPQAQTVAAAADSMNDVPFEKR